MTRQRIIGAIFCIALVAAACGDDDGDSSSSAGDTAVSSRDDESSEAGESSDDSDNDDDDDGSSGGGGEPGEVTIETDPGQGVVEVDGETIVLTWDEARFKSCSINENDVAIEFSLDDGRNLSIAGGNYNGAWNAIAYFAAGDSGTFQYELRFPDDASLGLSDTALSMEGDAIYMDGFTPVDDDLRPATIAVNCEGTE